MDEYENREKRKFNDLGGQLGGIVTALSVADAATKAATLERQIQILGMDNIVATAQTSIAGHDVPMQVRYDLPAVIVADMRSLVIKEATIETTMNINASTEDTTDIHSKTDIGGEASFGFGLFKATAKFSASVGVDKSARRKSDYSSSLNITINMAQSEAPEGMMRVIDNMNEVVKTATEINTALMVRNQPALADLKADPNRGPEPAA